MTEYQPGVCNIGPVERRRRLRLGLASLAGAVVYTAWVLGTDQRYQLLGGTAVLLFGALLGYLQYRLEFCVGFAALARYDLRGGATGDGAGEVEDATALFEDRVRAVQIVVVSLGLAVLLTFGIYFLDLLVLDPPRA